MRAQDNGSEKGENILFQYDKSTKEYFMIFKAFRDLSCASCSSLLKKEGQFMYQYGYTMSRDLKKTRSHLAYNKYVLYLSCISCSSLFKKERRFMNRQNCTIVRNRMACMWLGFRNFVLSLASFSSFQSLVSIFFHNQSSARELSL